LPILDRHRDTADRAAAGPSHDARQILTLRCDNSGSRRFWIMLRMLLTARWLLRWLVFSPVLNPAEGLFEENLVQFRLLPPIVMQPEAHGAFTGPHHHVLLFPIP